MALITSVTKGKKRAFVDPGVVVARKALAGIAEREIGNDVGHDCSKRLTKVRRIQGDHPIFLLRSREEQRNLTHHLVPLAVEVKPLLAKETGSGSLAVLMQISCQAVT